MGQLFHPEQQQQKKTQKTPHLGKSLGNKGQRTFILKNSNTKTSK